MGHAVEPEGADGRRDEARRQAASKGKDLDFKELLHLEPDGGTTNIRNNTSSGHWKRWLGPDNRCLVPF